MPDSEEIIRATRFEDAMSESVPPAVEEQGDDREEFACELCGKLILVPGRSYEIAPEAVCRCPTVPKSLLIAKQQQADRQNRRAENAEAALTTERHRTESAEQERDEQIEVVNGLGEKLDTERHRTQVAEGERDEALQRIGKLRAGLTRIVYGGAWSAHGPSPEQYAAEVLADVEGARG